MNYLNLSYLLPITFFFLVISNLSAQNNELLERKGDFKLTFSYNKLYDCKPNTTECITVPMHDGWQLSTSYSPVKHLGIKLDHFRVRESFYNYNRAEKIQLSIGGYIQLLKQRKRISIILDNYAGFSYAEEVYREFDTDYTDQWFKSWNSTNINVKLNPFPESHTNPFYTFQIGTDIYHPSYINFHLRNEIGLNGISFFYALSSRFWGILNLTAPENIHQLGCSLNIGELIRKRKQKKAKAL